VSLLLHHLTRLRGTLPRAAVLSFTVLYAWLGIVNLVSAEGLEGNRVVDMSALSCGEFLRIPLPQALIAVGWIGGFYAGLKNDPKVNVLVFADKADQIVALCRENESIGVMALVERTFHPLQGPSTE
jgi:hypothetical protein